MPASGQVDGVAAERIDGKIDGVYRRRLGDSEGHNSNNSHISPDDCVRGTTHQAELNQRKHPLMEYRQSWQCLSSLSKRQQVIW